MAYTKTPQISTYQSKTIQLAEELDSRGYATDKDQQFVNCYFEISDKQEKLINVIKRVGSSTFSSALPSAQVRGMYYWEDEDKVFVANSNDIVVINALTAATITTLSNVFGTTSGEVGFTEFIYDNNTVKVVATDGTTMITIDTSNTVVTGADADMPAHLPQPIFLDGYLFVVKTNSADLYNSNLNDPLAWTAGDFISCEMFPDTVVRIAKLNNYIVVFGSASIEYFWDAAIASGSPLQRNDTPVKLTGYIGGLAQHGNRIYFVGNTSTGAPDVFFLEDFKITAVGDETVRRYLSSVPTSVASTIGTVLSFSGHDFYVVNLSTITYVLDLKTNTWTRWAFKGNGNFACEAAVSVSSNDTFSSLFYINSETGLHKFDEDLYQDAGTNFTVTIITKRQMFDTYNTKNMHRLLVMGDRPSTSSNISVSWSDDDYQSFTTARTINLNSAFPALHQLGQFRRRAFKLVYTDNYPLRISGLEVDINIGQN